ncbi:MAG TPA: RDD family protein [Chloroflexota bacterium]|nr:RDD family protein [Chloroflexota bacterium]
MIEEYRVETPEAVALSYELAGIGTRFVAALIDLVVIVGMAELLSLATVGLIFLAGILGSFFLDAAIIFTLTSYFLLFWGYYIAFETFWSGQTPGKRSIGVRVIKVDGRQIRFVDALVRNLVRIVDFLPSLYGLGLLVMFIGRQPRRLGDYAAGTVVVKERKTVGLAEVKSEAGAVEASAAEPIEGEQAWPVERLTLDDAHEIRRILAWHRGGFRRPGPKDLKRLSARIGLKLGLGEPPEPQVMFLRRVLALYWSPPDAGKGLTVATADPAEQAWDLRRLSPEEAHIVDEFLGRAPTLDPAARRRLAEALAGRVSTEIGAAQDPHDPEAFLHRVAVLRAGNPSGSDS